MIRNDIRSNHEITALDDEKRHLITRFLDKPWPADAIITHGCNTKGSDKPFNSRDIGI